MGQQMSTLRVVFGRKNGDAAGPTKNASGRDRDGCSRAVGQQSQPSEAVVSADAAQPTDATVSCRDASTSAPPPDGDGSPSGRASSGSKKSRWLSRFNCRRPKSKNAKVPQQSSPPPPPPPPPPTPPPPPPPQQALVEDAAEEHVPPAEEDAAEEHVPPAEEDAVEHVPPAEEDAVEYVPAVYENAVERVPEPFGPTDVMMDDDPPCVCMGYRRAADVGTSMVYDEDDDEYVPDVIAIPVDDDDDIDDVGRYNEAASNDIMFHGFNTSFSVLMSSTLEETMMEWQSDFRPHWMGPIDDMEDRAYRQRAKEIQEGIDPPPGFKPGWHLRLLEFNLPTSTIDDLTSMFERAATAFNSPQGIDDAHRVHTSIDYIHYLVPDLLQITNCSFYWGKMDRYEAERLLENRAEGTFLLRDSAQEEYLFSVSFRKYGRSLHARIEQWNHMFSFDSRDPGVFASPTVCGLIEHYKDPSCCMFFEPMLTIPLNRNFLFSLQHISRATICNGITYDDVNQLKLPRPMKSYLKEYHYKQRVRVRLFDTEN